MSCDGCDQIFNVTAGDILDVNALTPTDCGTIFDCIIANGTATQFEALASQFGNLITVSTGPDGVIANATQTATAAWGENIHFWSSDGSVSINVVEGSIIADITSSLGALTFAVNASGDIVGTNNNNAAVLTIPASVICEVVENSCTAPANLSLAVTKTGSVESPGGVGDLINYTINVTNIGNQMATNIVPTDPKIASLTPASIPALGPGISQQFTGSYPITLSDITAGSITNDVSVSFEDNLGAPQLAVTASQTLTNADGLQLPDTDAPALVGCPPSSVTFVIGEAITPINFTADEDVTWTLDFAPPGISITSQTATSATISGTATGAGTGTMELLATDGQSNNAVCEFDFVAGAEPAITNCPGADVDIEQNTVFSLQLTSDDPTATFALAAGSTFPTGITMNAAGLISGTPPAIQSSVIEIVATSAAGIVSSPCSFEMNITQETVAPIIANCPGAQLDWIVGTPITDLNLSSNEAGSIVIVGGAASLPAGLVDNGLPGQIVFISGTPTAVGSGSFTVRATDLANNSIDCVVNFDITGSAALTITKSVSSAVDSGGAATVAPYVPGDVITYQVQTVNNGPVPATNVVVDDPLLSNINNLNVGTLAANTGTATLSGDYTVTEADAIAGTIVNTATANADAGVSDTDTLTVNTAVPTASIALTKTVEAIVPVDIDLVQAPAGSWTATNSASNSPIYTPANDMTMTELKIVLESPVAANAIINIREGLGGPQIASITPDTPITPGAPDLVTYTTNLDFTGGIVYEFDIAPTGVDFFIDPAGGLGNPDIGYLLAGSAVSPDVELQIIGTTASTTQPFSDGTTLIYTLTATNDGAQDLTGVTISDPLGTVTNPTVATLAQGVDHVATLTHVVTAAEAAAGQIDNTATVTSTATIGAAVPTDTANLVSNTAVAPTITNCAAASPLDTTPFTFTSDQTVTWSWDDNANSGLTLNATTGEITGTLAVIADGRIVRVTATNTTTGLTDICDVTFLLPVAALEASNLTIVEARNPEESNALSITGNYVGSNVAAPTFTAPFDMVITQVQAMLGITINGTTTRTMRIRDGADINGTVLGESTNTVSLNGPNTRQLRTANFDPIAVTAGQTVTITFNAANSIFGFNLLAGSDVEPNIGGTNGSEGEIRVVGFEIDNVGPFTGPYGPGQQIVYDFDYANTGGGAATGVTFTGTGGETFSHTGTLAAGGTGTGTITHTVTSAEGVAGSITSTVTPSGVNESDGQPVTDITDSNTVTTTAIEGPDIIGCPTADVVAINGQSYTTAAPLLTVTSSNPVNWSLVTGPTGYSVSNAGPSTSMSIIGAQFGIINNVITTIEARDPITGLTSTCTFNIDIVI